MAENTHILGNKMDRESLVKLSVVQKIIDKNLIEEMYAVEPFACQLLLDNFKEFLNDDYFEKLERQITLLKFLRNNYPIEISRQIVDYVNNCDLSDDYTRIVMEWNLFASDYIRKANLYQYDAEQFVSKKSDATRVNNVAISDNQEIINDIADLLLESMNYYDSE